MGRLRRLDIPIVSLVGKPAIRRQFLVVKSAGGDNGMAKDDQVGTEESYLTELRGALDGETPDVARALEIVKSLEDAVADEAPDGEETETGVEKGCGDCVATEEPKAVNGYINLSLSVNERDVKFWQLMDAMATVAQNIVGAEGTAVQKSELAQKAAEDFVEEFKVYMGEVIDDTVQKSETDVEDIEITVDVSKAGREFSARNKTALREHLSAIAGLVGFELTEVQSLIDDGDEGEGTVQKGDDEAEVEATDAETDAEGTESAEDEDLTDDEVETILEAVTGVKEAVSNLATKDDVEELVRTAADGGE